MRRWSVIVVVASVAVLAVIGLRLLSGQSTSTGAEAANPPAMSAEGAVERDVSSTTPARINEFGVPAGWSRDREGAVAAAVSAVRMTGSIATSGFITRSDMIGSLATERYGPILAAESATQLSEMSAELGAASVAAADLVWSEIPLTARPVVSDADDAQVEVWSVLVVAVPDVGAPRQVWRTVTIDLTWEYDDWKVDGWSTNPGPTPLLDATSAVATTDEMRRVLAWPIAPAGGG